MESRVRVAIFVGYALRMGVMAVGLIMSACVVLPDPERLVSVLSLPLSKTIDIGDGGFLSEDPCAPPCFWGIVPGQSTETEVVEILEQQGIYPSCGAWDLEFRSGNRGIECEHHVSITFQRGGEIVDVISFSPSNITVRDAVEKYGGPDSLDVGGLGTHATDYQMIMHYPQMLMLIRLGYQENLPYVVEPGTHVQRIVYGAIFDQGYTLPLEWQGYGEY